ncbi:hypothetical protein BDD12DRAFT_750701, partial [Trichophaea hybrida]
VLGQEHPYTLTGMNNLGHTYKLQDRIDQAITIMTEVVTLCSRILSEDHLYTKDSK